MDSNLNKALWSGGAIFAAGVLMTFRSRMKMPESIRENAAARARWVRFQQTSRWLGPPAMIVGAIIFFTTWRYG